MADDHIRYRSGYKYQLVNDYSLRVGIRPLEDITTEFIGLTVDGMFDQRQSKLPTNDNQNSRCLNKMLPGQVVDFEKMLGW